MVQLLDQTLPSLPSIPRDESYDWASPNVAGLMWTVPRLLPLVPCPPLWGERCETEEVPAVTSDLNPVTPRPRLSLANINWSSDSGLGLRPADCGKCGGQHQTDTLHTDTTTTTPPWGLPAISIRSHTVTRQTPGPAPQSDTVWTLMLASRNNWITLKIFRNCWHTGSLSMPPMQCLLPV